MRVEVIGGGPAGASAAIAARLAGAEVRLWEQSRLPRHKVCGEFLSPELLPLLDRLGVLGDFMAARPAEVRRMGIHLGRSSKWAVLPEPAYGLSRYAFDALLLGKALAAGAEGVFRRAPAIPPGSVQACGRATRSRRGGRLFGFKAHFRGPADDAVELFFFGPCYVGINAVENGTVNVCGLAPEELLREYGFAPDELIAGHEPLRARVAPLTRSMEWLVTGPLQFRKGFEQAGRVYPAGDALSFVDPFTGSGQLSAVLTGSLAGDCAARGVPVSEYLRRCRPALRRPFRISSWLRALAGTNVAEAALPLIPGGLLFRATRPRLAA